MSGNIPKTPNDTAELDFNVVSPPQNDTGRLPAPTYIPGSLAVDAVSAPNAIAIDEGNREPHPTVIPPPRDRRGSADQFLRVVGFGQLEASRQVSTALSAVDTTREDVAFDARVFEREPLSMRSASCAAFSTALDDITIQRIILRGTPNFKKVSISPKGSVWIYSCSGERSAVPTSEIYDDIRKASIAQKLPAPSVMFMHYQKQQDTSSVLDTFQREAGKGFSRLTEMSMFISEEAFMRAAQHPRVKVYIDAEFSTIPIGWLGKRFREIQLKPAINSIRAGGAEKQYGRANEEAQIRKWVDQTLCSGEYSSLTIHGDPMMGKTRMAAEIVRYVQQHYPDVTLVFAPAMDTHKAAPFHYVKSFTRRLVEGFSSRPDIVNTPVYQQLFAFTQGLVTDMSPNQLSTLLVSFFQFLPSSSSKLFLVPDDMQWPDAESNSFSTKVFAQNATFGNMAVLNLTRKGDEVQSPMLLAAMKCATSEEIFLEPLAFLDKKGEPTKMLSSFVADLLHVPDFDVPSRKDYLKRFAKISQGNPGILTEVVQSMYQDGVISIKNGRLTVDHIRFMAWTETGEADNIVTTKVDRLLQNEHYRDVLLHLVAFRESGACDADLFLKFLTNVLKKPELANAYSQLVAQQTIGLQQIGDRDEATLSFSQDLVGTRLKKEFTDEGSSYAPLYAEAHRVIAKFMFDMQARASGGTNPHLVSILERCNPRAIVTHASASGSLSKLAEGYAIRALTEAYKVGDHTATLSIYKSVVQSNPTLLSAIANDDALQLSVLHSMTVLRKDWGEMAVTLGEGLKEKYLKLLLQSTQYDKVLIARIEHLYDLMCTFYIMKGTSEALREESTKKLAEWGSGFGSDLFFNANSDIKFKEGRFFEIKESFYLMLAEYMQQRYAQACEMYASQFEIRSRNLNREFPDMEFDPRFQRLNLEATRVGANGWLMGFNRAEVPGLEGTIFAHEDEEACIVSSRDPNSSMHHHLLHAEALFRSYLSQATEHPDQVMDRTQVYRAKQAFARTLGMLGKYYESFESFLDARSDAHRYGDPERFADITDGATSMLSNMAKHFLTNPHDEDFQKLIMSIASLIRRSEQGESPDDHDAFTSLQYILKKAHQYSEQAARITADISHSSNFDTAMVNILDILETMMNSHTAFNRPLDPDVLHLLEEAMKRVLSPTHLLPDGKTSAPTFYERMTKLGENGKASAYWNLYIAPCLARLAVGSTQFDSEEVQWVFKGLLTQLGNCDAQHAHLLHSLHALTEEFRTPTKVRLPSYDQAVRVKTKSVEMAMDLLEERGLVQYSFV